MGQMPRSGARPLRQFIEEFARFSSFLHAETGTFDDLVWYVCTFTVPVSQVHRYVLTIGSFAGFRQLLRDLGKGSAYILLRLWDLDLRVKIKLSEVLRAARRLRSPLNRRLKLPLVPKAPNSSKPLQNPALNLSSENPLLVQPKKEAKFISSPGSLGSKGGGPRS